MSFKNFVANLTGKTSSSNVTIMEKTHFTGKYFRKVIHVEEFLAKRKENATELDKMLPHAAPHKLDNLDYRFSFRLDLSKRPEGMKVGDLVTASSYNSNYKALTELTRPWKVRLLTPTDDGRRTDYLGYTLSDWLEIEPDYIRDGELDNYKWRGYIRLFQISYESIYELHDSDLISLQKEIITIKDANLNIPIQHLLKAEAKLFAQECLDMMSPR
ncbi:hypothetical protein GCM10027422_47650 [Hymenobacter arcticus]